MRRRAPAQPPRPAQRPRPDQRPRPGVHALRRALALGLLTTLALVQAVVPAGAGGAAEDTSARATGLVVSQVLGLRQPADAPTGQGPDRGVTALWDWPLVGTPPVARGFDPPAHRWLPGHRGVDLAGVAGEQVLAVDAGVVTYSGEIAGVGMVSLTHADGLRSTYQPVEGRVARGDRLGRGQAVGVLGATGGHCAVADCLHLGAVRGRDDYVDPLSLLLGVELTLLPVDR